MDKRYVLPVALCIVAFSFLMYVIFSEGPGGDSVSLLLIVGALYFAPTIAAGACKKKNTAAIFVLNLLLGWTVIGWVVAFVWSCTVDSPPPERLHTQQR